MHRYLKRALGTVWILLFLFASCESPVDTERSGSEETDTDETEYDGTETDGTAPEAPEELHLSIAGGEVVLSWAGSASTGEGFVLYRVAIDDEAELVADLEADTTSYTDFSAADGEIYTYRLFAYNQFGVSQPIEETIAVPIRFTVTYHPGTGSTSGEVPVGATRYPAGQSAWIHDNTGGLLGPQIRDGICQRFLTWNTQESGDGDDRLNTYFSNIQTDVTMYAQYTTDDAVLGKIGPAGGLVFHERDGGTSGEWRFIEAAPVSTERPGVEWGPIESIDGTDGVPVDATWRAIGTGAGNTEAIIAWLNESIFVYETGFAAKVARGLDHGGYDWFLPSIDELQEMRAVLHSADPPLGSFGTTVYWSSTKGSGPLFTPFALNFGTGAEQQDTPINGKRVRAVRYF